MAPRILPPGEKKVRKRTHTQYGKSVSRNPYMLQGVIYFRRLSEEEGEEEEEKETVGPRES